jgi:hypothetical protein
MLRAVATIVLFSLLSAGGARAATLQPIGAFDQPIYVTSDPGNAERLFVVERAGKIIEVNGGATSTFADLSSIVSCCEGERGLLSIALAPNFDSSGRFYVDYTGKEVPGEIHVAELQASGGTAIGALPRNLLTIPHPGQSNHNGGQLQFGPDGDLYISTGDGGGANDQLHNAQNLTKPLGKILRIRPDPEGPSPYFTVPPENPFAGVGSDYAPIWSYGLRNPFRFSFDRLTGDMAIGDVGQAAREEIDFAPAPALGRGADYGWNCREGRILGPADDPQCSTPPAGGFVDPVFDYPHSDPGGGAAHGCAIIGGYVVRDPSLGNLDGRYLYGDLCTGELRSLELSSPFASDCSAGLQVDDLNSFGEDASGRIYVVSGTGAVDRLLGPGPASCSPVATPDHRPAFVGLRAVHRKVERHRRALITAWASPCTGRIGERVRLLRGHTPIASKRLNRACTAHFMPRIGRRTKFRATVAEDATYQAATSRDLKIKILHRRPRPQ